MRYKCLIIDYDDTAVISTPQCHYPAYRLIMKNLRPNAEIFDLAGFVKICERPGFRAYCVDELGFSEKEIFKEYKIWQDYLVDHKPDFYPGFPELIRDFQKAGGKVAVSSLSDADEITKQFEKVGISLDAVYGMDFDETKEKPNPYAVNCILENFKIEPKDILMVDDLGLGHQMVKPFGITFACAAWSHGLVPEIDERMKRESDLYFETVEDLRKYIFEEA